MPRKPAKVKRCLEMQAGASKKLCSPSRKVSKNQRYSVSVSSKEAHTKNQHADMQDYQILHQKSYIDALRSVHKAGACEGELQVIHHVDRSQYKLTIKCTTCKLHHEVENPSNEKGKDDITSRLVLGCLEAGVSLKQWTTICDLAELKPLLTKKIWKTRLTAINEAVTDIWTEVQEETVTEIKTRSDPPSEYTQCKVTSDGTWPTRGHISNNGMLYIMDAENGKVIDMGHRTKMCSHESFHKNRKNEAEYSAWLEKHRLTCKGTYKGSSGSMEADMAKEVWERSHGLGLEYSEMICDGDSKAYDTVKGTYGMCKDCENLEKKSKKDKEKYLDSKAGKIHSEQHASGEANCKKVKRADCTNHSEKRLGTSIRNWLKQRTSMIDMSSKNMKPMKRLQKKRQLLSDNKPAGGRSGRMTGEAIQKMTRNFGNAIRAMKKPSACSPQERRLAARRMKKRCMATLYHALNIPDHRRHELCPEDWCTYKRNGKPVAKKSHHLDAVFEEELKPIYEKHTSLAEMERCLGGYTQNQNESIHSKLYIRLPKHKFMGEVVVKLLMVLTAIDHNIGKSARTRVLKKLGCKSTDCALQRRKLYDLSTINKAEDNKNKASERHRASVAKHKKEAAAKETEGATYESGHF